MKLSIATVLEALRSAIASEVRGGVFVGRPDDAVGGLYIVPVRYASSPLSERAGPMPGVRRPEPGYELGCLLVASPGDDFATLEDGIAFLRSRPVLAVGEETIRIVPADYSLGQLTRVFRGLGVSLRLALSFDVLVGGGT
jgi:hypothetical protein